MTGEKIFLGKEAEGPDRDTLTLFVGKSDVDLDEVAALIKSYCVSRVYFGAGGVRKPPCNLYAFVCKYINKYKIVVEVDLLSLSKIQDQYKDLFDHRNFSLVLSIEVVTSRAMSSVNAIKLEDGSKLFWYEVRSVHKTYKDNVNYKTDNQIVFD
jgi:hypothetical protein